jgi:hypothetical protein
MASERQAPRSNVGSGTLARGNHHRGLAQERGDVGRSFDRAIPAKRLASRSSREALRAASSNRRTRPLSHRAQAEPTSPVAPMTSTTSSSSRRPSSIAARSSPWTISAAVSVIARRHRDTATAIHRDRFGEYRREAAQGDDFRAFALRGRDALAHLAEDTVRRAGAKLVGRDERIDVDPRHGRDPQAAHGARRNPRNDFAKLHLRERPEGRAHPSDDRRDLAPGFLVAEGGE